MNKVIALSGFTVIALLLTLGVLAPGAIALGPQGKVLLCHNDDGTDGIRGTSDDGWEVIEINGHAVDKHIANHTDEETSQTAHSRDFTIGTVTNDTCASLIAANPVE